MAALVLVAWIVHYNSRWSLRNRPCEWLIRINVAQICIRLICWGASSSGDSAESSKSLSTLRRYVSCADSINGLRKSILPSFRCLERPFRCSCCQRWLHLLLVHFDYRWTFTFDVRLEGTAFDFFTFSSTSFVLKLSFFHLQPQLRPLLNRQSTIASIRQDRVAQFSRVIDEAWICATALNNLM